jgi:hypothetical protein
MLAEASDILRGDWPPNHRGAAPSTVGVCSTHARLHQSRGALYRSELPPTVTEQFEVLVDAG